MSPSRKAAERFFGTPAKAFLPSSIGHASSKILAVALVVGAAASVDLRNEAVAAPQGYAASGSQQAQYPDARDRVARGGSIDGAAAQGYAAPGRPGAGYAADRGDRRYDGPGAPARPGLLGGIKGAFERKLDRVIDHAYERRERRVYEGYGYGRPAVLPVPVAVPVYGAGRAYGPALYGPVDAVPAGAVPVVLDRQSGDYVFGAGRVAIRVGKDVVENVYAAARMVDADPALVMALSWRSGAAAEHGALPASGVRVAGMFAYSEQRFLEEMRQWGGSLGVGDLVSSIRRTPEGALVAVGRARDTFEGMRSDIHASAVVGAANAKSAQAHLEQAAPGRHGAADLLVAVQFGNDVALSLITARMTNPHKPMTGPLADVVAGMGLPAVDETGRPWTIASFHDATEMRLRSEIHAFSGMRTMQLAEQHRPAAPQNASYPAGPRF
jgi:hypothetical protein